MRHTPGAYAVGPYLLHQRTYRLTGGAIGRHVGGRPALMLHTVGRRRRPVTARVAEGDERERLWEPVDRRTRGLAPLLHRDALGRDDVYQRDTDRQIPVVVLTPDTDGEPG